MATIQEIDWCKKGREGLRNWMKVEDHQGEQSKQGIDKASQTLLAMIIEIRKKLLQGGDDVSTENFTQDFSGCQG